MNLAEAFIMPTETILRLLENGKWHNLKDIENETRLDRFKVENVTKFLANYNFVKLDEARQKVKLDPPTTKFLKRLRQLENEEKH
jgi:DNA-binding IclR family transcriptional regulator